MTRRRENREIWRWGIGLACVALGVLAYFMGWL